MIETIFEFIIKFLIAFITTYAFTILFNLNNKTFKFFASLSGGIGYLVYLFFINYKNSAVLGCFFGALFVGMFGEYLARKLKAPATIFIIPGIFPIVPGYGMYYTMLAIVDQNYRQVMVLGFSTFISAISIAIAVMLSTIFSVSLIRVKRERIK